MSGKISRIVVVEDDPSMSQAIERILRAGGFAAQMFDSAEAALESGKAPTADCLVLDIHLPGISGLEFYRQLAHRGNQPPAIVITARDDPAVREEVKQLAASHYLHKPFSGRALLDAVGEAIHSR
jgi:DNA-binding response OmpR family regulator